LLSHFDSAIATPDPIPPQITHTHKIPIIGVSATFSRHDGLALGSVFEQIVYHHDFLSMIKDQWLSNVRFTTVKANIDLSNVTVNSRSGDFQASSLAHVINTPQVNNLVVKTWLDKAGSFIAFCSTSFFSCSFAADRKSTLVFCVNLAHVRDLTNAFRQAGVDAQYVYSGTRATERPLIISAFREGKFPVLINCGMTSTFYRILSLCLSMFIAILTEGADIPNIDCVVIARPTRSRNIFAQMVCITALRLLLLSHVTDWPWNAIVSSNKEDGLPSYRLCRK
jgi:ATP-dependent helicase IRC3